MPTVCRITLDAEQYRHELQRVVEETRAAASSMQSNSTEGLSQVTMPEIPEVEDQEYIVTGTVNAPEIPEVEDQEYVITGTVNAPEIPEVEDQTYTITGNIDVPDAAGEVFEDIADGAADAAGEVGKAGGKIGFFSGLMAKLKGMGAGEQIGKGAAAIGAVGAAAGASVPPVGALAAVVNALLSPIAILTMALTALAALGTAVWDALTISADEYGAHAEHAAKMAEREAAKLKEQAAAAQQYMARLKELDSAEGASRNSKIETLSLLQNLQKEYGDLGAQIDSTTGKIKNLDEVEKNLRRSKANKEAETLRWQADAKRREARTEYMRGLGDSYSWTETGAGKNWDARMSKNQDINAQIADLHGVYNWAKNDNYSAATLSGISKSIQLMEEVRDLQARAGELEKTSFGSDAEKASAIADAKKSAMQEKQRWRDARKAALRREQDDAFENADTFSEKRKNRQDILNKEAEYYKKLTQYQNYLAQQRKKITSKYSSGQRYSAEDIIAIAQWDEKIAKTGTRIVESEGRQVILRKQLKSLAQQEAEELKKQREIKEKLLDDADYEYDYSRLIAKGMFDKAAALKLEHDLREKNIKLTKKEKEALKDTALAQDELNLQVDLHKKATDLKYRVMEQAGRGQEANHERMLQEAQATKGRKLDKTEQQWIKELADLSFSLNNMQEPRLGDLSIKTNALASRGGFQGSVKLPSSAQYNRVISENTKQLLTTIQRIETLCRQLGEF